MAKEKKLFIAATRQNDGKTVVSLGLAMALRERTPKISFVKPVGQRYVNVGGKKIDEDALLIEKVCKFGSRLQDTSPIAIERGFTQKYIDRGNIKELEKRIKKSYRKVAAGKELVMIEGTGHAGVGSVFDLNNAKVARLLGAKVLLITIGGIGRPIDEIMLNRALFTLEGVEIMGVIVNKAIPEKMGKIKVFLKKGLEKKGLKLFGVIPYVHLLSTFTVAQVAKSLNSEVISGKNILHRRILNTLVGAMTPHKALAYISEGSLVITPGDREDIILTSLATGKKLAGLVLTGGMTPESSILKMIKQYNLPTLLVKYDTYTTASKIHDIIVKVKANDEEKLTIISELIENYVDVDGIYKAL
jgi:BioD-like phosphotransacetylase family protein